MEQHPLGVADRGQTVMVIFPGPLLAVAAGGAELRQVSQGEVSQLSSGLDQQPDWLLGSGGEPDPFGESQIGRRGEEPVQVSGQR
jgi:hypothetical protein